MSDFLNESIFKTNAELIVVPMSTIASVSAPFESGLKSLGLKPVLSRQRYKLGEVEIVNVESPAKVSYIAFACCVEDFESDYACIRSIGIRLAQLSAELGDVHEIATPLLGTGSGKLDARQSRNIMYNAFFEAGGDAIRFVFCTPDPSVFLALDEVALDTNTLSAQLVIEAELSRLLSIDEIYDLLYKRDFYYELAAEKFKEFDRFHNETLFFSSLLARFRRAKLSFQRFLVTLDPAEDEYTFLVLCGELIAYCDYYAYRKNIWNQYPDKRVLARSGVNQNNWLVNLLLYKSGGTDDMRSGNIRNALAYLEDPVSNLTMLSEDYRDEVVRRLFLPPGDSPDNTGRIINFFRQMRLPCQNRLNQTALYTRILFLPVIKKMWHDKATQDELTVREGKDDGISRAAVLIQDCLDSNNTELDLGNCGLDDLSFLPELFECVHLEVLVLSNEWAEYEDGKWRERFSRNKGEANILRLLPEGISKLVNLRKLYAGGDWKRKNGTWNRWEISSVRSLSKLNKLHYLNLSNNTINHIGGLSNLNHLEVLHLNNNEIADADVLSRLPKLRQLYLSNNFLKDISFFKRAKQLDTLDLHHNLISDISPLQSLIAQIGVTNTKWETNTINIAKNPLEIPPMSIIVLGKQAVLSTLQYLKTGDTFINKDIKVVLIGNSEAGKSTMAKYLDDEKGLGLSHPATHGMVEKLVKSKYEIKKISGQCDLHLFDFGGHDYYHDTHHLFFSRNTLYLLLWDKETDNLQERTMIQDNTEGDKIQVKTQDYPVNYWLESVKYFTKDVEAENFEFKTAAEQTYNSRLLMIQNKVKGQPDIKHTNNLQLSNQFPFIFDFLNISVFDPPRNLAHFDAVFTEMLDQMNIIGEVLPDFYRTVKEAIKVYSGAPVLNDQQFYDYCNGLLKRPITFDQSIILARYLDQVGILICTRIAGDWWICINKAWVMDNIYRVLDGLKNNNGEFTLKDVRAKLQFDDEQTQQIIELMSAFKIVFRHPGRTAYIAPLYLPKMPPASVGMFLRKNSKPYRRFEYTGFIHKHLILALFNTYGQLINDAGNGAISENSFYWKDALVFKEPRLEEIVMIRFVLGDEQGNARIDVYSVNDVSPPVFIEQVIAKIRELNKGYDTEEMVSVNGGGFVSLQLLRENAVAGKWVFTECRLSERRYANESNRQVFHLKSFRRFINDDIKKKQVMISYSKRDLRSSHSLIRFLEPLIADGLIETPWICEHLGSADEWLPEIKERFEQADVVFFLVSSHLFVTDMVVNYEIPSVIDRYDTNKSVKIIPVIIDFYDWKRKGAHDLSRFSCLPFQAKPIADYDNPNLAWSHICSAVRLMIEKDLDPENTKVVDRYWQAIFERQVAGELDKGG